MHYQIPQQTSLVNFVKYWAEVYDYANEPQYTNNIGQPLTKKGVLEFFFWKNGGKLSKLKKKSVRDHYISNISNLKKLPRDTPPDQWLKKFGTGGAIWNIFFLHVWDQQFPIFDQHVYRAMRFIESRQTTEIPIANARKIEIYLKEYLPFYKNLEQYLETIQPRDLDRALWKFGQFLKWLEPPAEDDADENSN